MMNLTKRALNIVEAERARQDAMWGRQRHSSGTWLKIIGEEFGEVCQAMQHDEGWYKQSDKGNEIEELSHLAATAIARMEQLLEEE